VDRLRQRATLSRRLNRRHSVNGSDHVSFSLSPSLRIKYRVYFQIGQIVLRPTSTNRLTAQGMRRPPQAGHSPRDLISRQLKNEKDRSNQEQAAEPEGRQQLRNES